MTAQPKPMHLATGKDRVEVWLNRPTKKEPVAIFFGPDRETNARKFMHMDELVKWADEFIALEDSALKEWAKESFIPWTGNEPCMVRLKDLKAIRAKIDGGK